IGQLAWNLVAWFKRLCLPKEYHQATVKTIRHQLLKVAGKIVHQARQFFLVLSDQYWYQDAWSFALKQLAKLQILRLHRSFMLFNLRMLNHGIVQMSSSGLVMKTPQDGQPAVHCSPIFIVSPASQPA